MRKLWAWLKEALRAPLALDVPRPSLWHHWAEDDLLGADLLGLMC